MKDVRSKLLKLQKLKKHEYHHFIHKIHKRHNISKRTLFYVKEYGQHTHVSRTIIKESIKVLFFASIISSLGGLAIEQIKTVFVSIMPLVILLPALNDMIGDYGTIISSKFSTLLYENKVNRKWWKEGLIKRLFLQVVSVALITTVLSTMAAFVISSLSKNAVSLDVAYKVFLIAIIDVVALVSVLFLVAILAGTIIYRKKEDPSNFLIPITTSVADFGNMLILAMLVMAFF
ncbi:magnesium transporter [Candidatus Woesearchaeota archaeon]|nr:magnesium transporter [Candidatus Woesearchaeota archaeon]